MKSVAVLALAALATCLPQIKLPHEPGTPYPSVNYKCYQDIPDWHACNFDKTMTQCTNNVGTVYNCVGGCEVSCVKGKPCTPICKDPFNGDTWKYEDNGEIFHQP